MSFAPVGKVLVIAGGAMMLLGIFFLFSDKIPFLGKLPGDIVIRKKNFSLYFPLATSILLSLILTAVLFVITLFRK